MCVLPHHKIWYLGRGRIQKLPERLYCSAESERGLKVFFSREGSRNTCNQNSSTFNPVIVNSVTVEARIESIYLLLAACSPLRFLPLIHLLVIWSYSRIWDEIEYALVPPFTGAQKLRIETIYSASMWFGEQGCSGISISKSLALQARIYFLSCRMDIRYLHKGLLWFGHW